MNTTVERLFRFDLIRASKLLEIVQFTLVIFVLGFIIGSKIDQLFPIITTEPSNIELIRDISLQLALLSIAIYYITKIAQVIPFVLSLTNQYIPSMKGEALFGGSIALTIIFVGVQKNFQARLALLKSRFYA